jgi:hypothetical protein
MKDKILYEATPLFKRTNLCECKKWPEYDLATGAAVSKINDSLILHHKDGEDWVPTWRLKFLEPEDDNKYWYGKRQCSECKEFSHEIFLVKSQIWQPIIPTIKNLIGQVVVGQENKNEK